MSSLGTPTGTSSRSLSNLCRVCTRLDLGLNIINTRCALGGIGIKYIGVQHHFATTPHIKPCSIYKLDLNGS
jgi:hypothetical protein